jgi:hypothetical protein
MVTLPERPWLRRAGNAKTIELLKQPRLIAVGAGEQAGYDIDNCAPVLVDRLRFGLPQMKIYGFPF